MDAETIKKKIEIAQKAVEGLEEPMKTNTYEIVLNKLLSEIKTSELETEIEQEKNLNDKDGQFPIVEGKSLKNKITSLLDSEWGKSPRNLNEIKKALELGGYHYPSTTISPVLIYLTRKGVLRRLHEGKTLSYVLAKR